MKKTCIFIASSLLLGSSFLYANKTATTSVKTHILKNNKVIATIPILTPVEIIRSKGEFSTIKIKGFRQESYPQMVVRDMKRGELYMEFPEEKEELANKSFNVIKNYEDDYGDVWNEVEGEFTIKTKTLTTDATSLNKKAKTTYEQMCSMCHRLHNPKDFTVNQWPHQVESMEDQAPINPKDKELIVKYLQQNAADAK